MKKAIIPAVVLILFAGLGCDLFSIPPDGGGGGQDEWQEPLTPRAVIEDIQYCYNTANYPYYTILLDVDNFVFYFDPQDVQKYDLPTSWTYVDETEATLKLFDAVGASNIVLGLDFSGCGNTEPDPNVTTFDIDNVAYTLRVTVPDKDLIYLAQAHANFELSKFEEEDTHLMRWWLTLWWDMVTG